VVRILRCTTWFRVIVQRSRSAQLLLGVLRYNRLVAEARTMHPTSERVKLTYEDLLALPDDGMRHELIDGEHYVTPSPASAHQLILGNLYYVIRSHLEHRRLGVIMFAPFDIILSKYDVVVPDLIYFSSKRFKRVVDERNAQGPPDLAVEVLSPSTRRRDIHLKRNLYERKGVGEYWVVDPKRKTIKISRLNRGKYRNAADLSLESRDVLTSPLFPKLKLPLVEIFKLA